MDIMKKLNIIIFLLMALQQAGAMPADSLNKYLNKGNELYGQDKYAEAISAYNKILEQGYESGVLYYNLGNAYYRLGKFGYSRLYYEKAKKLLKNDDDLNHNLQLLRLKLVDKIKEPPKFILYRWRDALLDLFNMSFYTWMVAILFWLSILLAIIRLSLKRQYKLDSIETIHKIILIIFVFFLFIFMQKVYFVETNESAVVIETTVTIYAEPNVHGTEVFVLHEGTKVKVERKSGNWYEIRLADGKSGWVENKNLETI
jgi:tetratricopeptide (TPR) repeat protein